MDLSGLWWLSIGAEIVALASLLLRRIARYYPWFTAYLAFGVIRGIALHFAGDPRRSTAYAVSWMATTPALLALLIAATIEIVSRVPDHYRGFGSFGRRKMRRLLDLAITMALLSSILEAGGPHWHFSGRDWLVFVIALNRLTTTTLAVYLVLVAAFVSRVRVPFRHNLVVHSRLFACYLCLNTSVMLWQSLMGGGHGTWKSNLALTGGSTALFLLWAVLLTRAGEKPPPRKVMTPIEVRENEDRERALQEAARRYSDRPFG